MMRKRRRRRSPLCYCPHWSVYRPRGRRGPVYDPVPTEPVTSRLGPGADRVREFPQSHRPAADRPAAQPGRPDQHHHGGARRLRPAGRARPQRQALPRGERRAARLPRRGAPPSRRSSSPAAGSARASATSPSTPTSGATACFYTIHTEDAATTTATPDYAQPNARLPRRHHRVDGDRPGRRHLRRHPPRGAADRLRRPGPRHPGDQLQPDRHGAATADYGLLYLAVGDGGQGAGNTDPQNLAIPHGKLLRIDPRGTNAPNGRYGIPAVEPVRRAGRARSARSTRTAIRDPHRFSWDRATGRLYLGHIGEHAIEAIYEVRAGDNFGWSEREGRSSSTGPPTTAATGCTRCRPTTQRLHLPGRRVRPQPAAGLELHLRRRRARWPAASSTAARDVPGAARQVRLRRPGRRPGALHRGGRDAPRPARRPPIHQLQPLRRGRHPVRMQDLSAPGAPGDPNRVDLRFGTDARGRALHPGQGQRQGLEGDRHPHVRRPARSGTHPGPRHHAAGQLGAGHPVEVAVHRRPGDPRRGGRRSGPARGARSSTRC